MTKEWKQLTVKFEPAMYDKMMELAMRESIGRHKHIGMGEWVRKACAVQVSKFFSDKMVLGKKVD